jgi:adhesin transport system outer membrane protein
MNKLTIVSLLITLLFISTNSLSFTIHEAIEDAIIHNPEFRQEVKIFRANQSEVSRAKGGYFPVIDINAGIGYEEVNRPGLNNLDEGLTRRETSIKITQNIFEGFGTLNEVRRQESKRDSSSFKAHATANEVALKMATAYINLLREKDIMLLAEDNLDTHMSILQQINKRYRAGIGNQVEVDQAKARLALARSSLDSAENGYYDAFAKFQRILGRKPSNSLVRPKFTFKLPATLETATKEALISHPILLSANADIASAKAQRAIANKNYYPNINLDLEKTFDRNLSGVEGKNEFSQAMIRLKYNLYNGGKDNNNSKRTISEHHRSIEIRNNSRRQVIENLRFAWNAIRYINEQIRYQNQHIKLSYKTLTGYRKQFNLGRRSLLDLLNTKNENTTAIRTMINSKADLITAKYRVLSATGSLIDKLGIKYSFIAAEGNYDDE